MGKFTVLLLGSFCSLASVHAQQRTVTGKVTNAQGQPVENVTVQVKGTNVATITAADGSYSLATNATSGTLVFSVVGFAAQEKAIGDNSTINVTLVPANQNLSEVVVVAYGTARRETFTGSAARIDGAQIANRPLSNPVSALVGAAPGVQGNTGSGQPGVAPAIRIRGFGSVNAASGPLYVVDGVPFTGSIANINSDDIESMTILKDAASTSLYGSRAANGVVVITTKRGRRGKAQISARATYGVSTRGIPEYDRVGPADYYVLLWEAYRNSLAFRANNPLSLDSASRTASGRVAGQNGIKDLLGYNPFNVAANDIVRPDGTINPNAQLIYSADDLDWAKAIARNGIRNDYNVTFGGAAEKTDYFISLGYLNDKGYTLKTDFERYTGRLNVNSQVTGWLRTGLNLSGSFVKSNIAQDPTANNTSSAAFVNPFNFTRSIGPIYPIYAQNPTTGAYILDPTTGERQYDYGNSTVAGLPARPGGAIGGRHIIAETLFNENFFDRNFWGARTFAEVSPIKDLKATINLAVDASNSVTTSYGNKLVGDAAPAGGLFKASSNATTITLNQLLNYNKRFGIHSLDALLGHESYSFRNGFNSAYRTNQVVDGIFELVNFTVAEGSSSGTDLDRIESYFSRVNYGLNNRYFISASYRTDGSSRFSPEKRWGDFWSVSGAWKLDEEDFIRNMKIISQLKLRASYGETGNNQVLAADGLNSLYYPWQPLFSLDFNNGTEPGIIRGNYDPDGDGAPTNYGSFGNRALTWEANRSFDVGLEFGLFKNRLSGTVEFFRRISDNLLFDVPLPITSGLPSQTRNIGSMYNQGLELSLSGDIIQSKDVTWNLVLNGTTFKNEITRLPQAEIISGTKKLQVGKSIFDYWLRDWQGVDPADGAALYRAQTFVASNSRVRGKDDTVTVNQNNARFAYHGSAIPDFYGSVQTTVRYKVVDLSALVTYQIGGKIYDGNYIGLMSSGNYGAAAHVDLLQRWRKPGDVTNVPRMDVGQTAAFNANSSRWLTDASNIFIRNITVGAALPRSVADRIKVQNARLYISGENLRLFAKRSGMNPEQNFAGVTTNVYNPARIVTVGLNLNL